MSPEPVCYPPGCDSDEPGAERPARIVNMPDRMYCQENILDRIFDIVRITMTSGGNRPDVGRDSLEQPPIGGTIASLGASHENGPVKLTHSRRRCTRARPIRINPLLWRRHDVNQAQGGDAPARTRAQ